MRRTTPMNKTLTNLFILAAGAAIGSVATWKFVKDKYRRQAQEEIDEVREYYAELMRNSSNDQDTEPAVDIPEKPTEPPMFSEQERVDYANLASNYTVEKGAPVTVQIPEVITPGEFGEYGYPTVSLTYYADGVLVDEYGDVIDPADVESMIGADFERHFGEYEEDSVFVRNDRLETDYEILRDYSKYSDVRRNSPIQGDE
jgi:hypothetical protein